MTPDQLLLQECWANLLDFRAILTHKNISPPMNPGVQDEMAKKLMELILRVEQRFGQLRLNHKPAKGARNDLT